MSPVLHPTVVLSLLALVAAVTASVLALGAARRLRRRAMIDAGRLAGAGGEPPRARGLLRLLVAPLAVVLRPGSPVERDRLVTRLQHAGRRGRAELDAFLEEKVLWNLAGVGLAIVVAVTLDGAAAAFTAMMVLLFGLLAGERLLGLRAAERRAAVSRSLPAAVDLLVTCLDAGLPLDQAVARVAADFRLSDPILAEELQLTASELEAGVPLAEALRRLARRVGLDELSTMCGVIAQASTLGAPIAATLRAYAVASRRQRLSELEERAGKLSTHLTFPLALCLLPAALLIILGPAAVQLSKVLE